MGIAPDQHLVLVGLMGSGKTTVARIVAERLGRQVIDSDAVIEGATGRTVRQIFLDDR
ncbi:MAG: shikimate kinase, partial [Ilumatobacteraceae bacterium]